jgi:membrane-associated phospholipid phosphatase
MAQVSKERAMRARRLTLLFAFITTLVATTPLAAQDLARAVPHELFAPADLVGTVGADHPSLFLRQDVPGVTKEEVHPTPAHTGFGAFVRTTAADFAYFPRRPSTWVILGIGAGAALLAHPVDDDVNSHIAGSDMARRFFAPGKIIGAAGTQVAVSTALYFGGRYFVPAVEGAPRTNKWSHLGYDLLRAQILSQAFIHGIKYTVRRDRPTGECCSFPSGHAATAFAAASVIERHLGYRAAWPTLLAATYVATSRLHDNRHFISDVLFGSAVGMATGWTIVGRHGRNEYALAPLMPVNGGFGIALTRTPKFTSSN